MTGTPEPLQARIDNVADFLDRDHGDEEFTALRQSEIVGRPIGDDQFLVSLEARLGQTLRRKKPGPRKKAI